MKAAAIMSSNPVLEINARGNVHSRRVRVCQNSVMPWGPLQTSPQGMLFVDPGHSDCSSARIGAHDEQDARLKRIAVKRFAGFRAALRSQLGY